VSENEIIDVARVWISRAVSSTFYERRTSIRRIYRRHSTPVFVERPEEDRK